jgi:DNA polymerase III subunit gamma/tau
MSYLVLARKWRPKSFAEMVGQGHVLQALTNALDQSRLHHAYLFSGTRGVGKTTVARIFAKALNCEHGISSTPCGVCSACVEIDQGRFVDLIEVDAASRTGVDDTRDLLENVAYAPVRGRFKIYLIDEVHMFSKSSFNALLKTLEEPPEHVKFLLATTDPQKLPVTVLSRCLQFNLRPLPHSQIQQHLADVLQKENISFEPAALHLIAEAANGSMRDALSLLDQAIAFTGGQLDTIQVSQILGLSDHQVIWDMISALQQRQAERLFALVDEALDRAVEPAILLAQFIEATHQLAMGQWMQSPASSANPAPEALKSIDPQLLQLWYQIATTGRRDMAWSPNARLGLEMTLLRMLAFQPGGESTVSVAMPSKQTSVRYSPPQPDQVPMSSGHKAHESASLPVAESVSGIRPQQKATEIRESEPIRVEPVVMQNEPETAHHAPAQLTDLPWHEWVERIPSQPGRNLADRCHLNVVDGVVQLVVAPQFEVIANARARESLLSQLSRLVDTSKVKIVIGQSDTPSDRAPSEAAAQTAITPAERRNQEEVSLQQQRRESVIQHPVVQLLQEQADAHVVEESILPCDAASDPILFPDPVHTGR